MQWQYFNGDQGKDWMCGNNDVLTHRPHKRVVFATTGFLLAQNFKEKERDSRQNLYGYKNKAVF